MDSMNLTANAFVVAAPEVWVLVMGCVLLMVDLVLKPERRGIIHMLAFLTLVFAAIITMRGVSEVAGQPLLVFDGMFVRDTMADVLKVFAYLTLGMVFVYAKFYLRNFGLFRADFYVLSLFALLGAMVLISAANLVTVYLGLEMLSLSTYALVAMDRDSKRGSEAAMKYFVLGSMASGMLLYGMSMVYGATGSLSLDVISAALIGAGPDDTMVIFGLVFLVVGVAFKLGVVPFHMWVPDVYQGAPAAITVFISSVPKLAAFAMAYRLLEAGLGNLHEQWQGMLGVLAALSLVVGNLAAIVQDNIKRMLAYSTISHMGFVLLGLLPGTASGFGAGMFYVIVYALMSAAAFGVVILLSARGIEAERLEDFKGLNQRDPWYAAVMAMVMFSMAGVPVFVGFFAKWLVIQATLEAGMLWLAILAVVFSVIGAFYYLRVVKLMYFDEPTEDAEIKAPVDFRAVLSFNGVLMLGLGMFSSALIGICMSAFAA